jgi:hypothetical protein
MIMRNDNSMKRWALFLLFSSLGIIFVYGQNGMFMTNFGTSANDKGLSGIPASHNAFIITGYSDGFSEFSTNTEDIYITRLDNTGTINPFSKIIGSARNERSNFIDYSYLADGTLDGYIITGYSEPEVGGHRDLLLVRVNEAGKIMASKSFGVSNLDEVGLCVKQDEDLNYVAVGYLQEGSKKEILVMKADRFLNLMWSKTFPLYHGSDNCVHEARALAMATGIPGQNGKFLSQTYAITGNIDKDFFVMLLDKSGNIMFSKSSSLSAVSVDVANSIQQTVDGGFIIAGGTSTSSHPTAGQTIFVHKTDMLGNPVKTLAYNFPLSEREYATYIQLKGSGYVLTGRAYDKKVYTLDTEPLPTPDDTIKTKIAAVPAGEFGKAFLINLFPNYEIKWAKTYLDPQFNGSHANRVEVMSDKLFVVGYTWIQKERIPGPTPVPHPDPEGLSTLKLGGKTAVTVPPPISIYPRYNTLAFTTGLMGNISADGGACFKDDAVVKQEISPQTSSLHGFPVAMAGSRSAGLSEAVAADYQCHCWSCASPVGLKAELGQIESGKATLSWDQFPCHESFQGKIKRGDEQTFSSFISLSDNKVIKNLDPGNTYDWKLRARCTNKSISPYSTLVSFSTWPVKRDMNSELAEIHLSPNPAAESVRIDFAYESTAELNLVVHDFTGRLISEFNLPGKAGSFEIPTSDLSDGLYLIEVRNGIEKIAVEKLMIQH